MTTKTISLIKNPAEFWQKLRVCPEDIRLDLEKYKFTAHENYHSYAEEFMNIQILGFQDKNTIYQINYRDIETGEEDMMELDHFFHDIHEWKCIQDLIDIVEVESKKYVIERIIDLTKQIEKLEQQITNLKEEKTSLIINPEKLFNSPIN